MKLKQFIEKFGQPYSEELRIDLTACNPAEICKWFLASILFAARINETIAKETYKEFERRSILKPVEILDSGWGGLVEILDAGGYVRYDSKTADKLLEVFGNLQALYNGDMNELHETAKDPKDLEEKIKALGKGIGDVTVSIFLREMRCCWEKADPQPTPLVRAAMKNVGIADLRGFSKEKDCDLVKLETALLRLSKNHCRKKRCGECFVRELCRKS